LYLTKGSEFVELLVGGSRIGRELDEIMHLNRHDDKINGVVLDTRNWNVAEDDNTPNIIPKISIKLQTPDPYKKTPESPH